MFVIALEDILRILLVVVYVVDFLNGMLYSVLVLSLDFGVEEFGQGL